MITVSMRHVLACAAMLSAFVAAAAPSVHAQTGRAALVARLDSLAGAPVHEGRAVGISVAVVQGGDTLLLRSYGMADVELDVPTPQRAVYEIGSVTKQFTAAAILQLRDQGRLSLDDELTKYLPDYPTHGRSIPIRRLLDHTSGIRGLTEIAEFRELQHRGWPRDSAIAMIARQPFDFEPGEAMIYNNSAYVLLGHIVEKTSGMSYEQYVEDIIFDQLGMDQSSYCSNSQIVKGRTSGYGYMDEGLRRAPQNDHTWPFSAGSLCSSAGDLVTWLHALHGGVVLSDRGYRDMTSPSSLADGTPLRYGMALALGPDPRGAARIGHGGAIAGYNAYAGWYPDAKLAVVVLMNSIGGVSPEALAGELAGAVIPPVRSTMRPFEGDATPLLGRYTGPARGRPMTVEITRGEQGGLLASVNGAPPQPLPWMDGWTFGRQGSNIFTFERVGTTSGSATLLRLDAGGGYYMLVRQP